MTTSSQQQRSVGVLHVHSDESGSGGTLQEIVEAAEECGLDFVIVTDRGTRGYGNRLPEGWRGRVLILFGEEVSTPEGHFLALGGEKSLGEYPGLAAALDAAGEEKLLRVSIHHQLPGRRGARSGVFPPPVPLPQAEILEVWSFFDEFLAQADGVEHPELAMDRPEKLLRGPARSLLRAWDEELATRNLPIAGGLNAHQKKQPLLNWRVLFPYRKSFSTVRTILPGLVLDQEDGAAAKEQLLRALRHGESYVANDSLADSQGFSFEFTYRRGGKRWQMGTQAPFRRGGVLHVTLPQKAEIVLRLGGQPVFWGTGEKLDFPCVLPGVYRVEVYLDRRMWILSNPIRLHTGRGGVQPTVSDVT